MRAALLALVVGAALAAPNAAAADGGHRGPGGSFGLGLTVGEPTGLSAEFGLGGDQALQLAVGFAIFEGNAPYFHLVWKFYLAELASGNPRVPLYLGLGGFVSDLGDPRIGVRAPLGIALDFRTAPIHIFFELALKVTLVDRIKAGVGGAVGFHYFF